MSPSARSAARQPSTAKKALTTDESHTEPVRLVPVRTPDVDRLRAQLDAALSERTAAEERARQAYAEAEAARHLLAHLQERLEVAQTARAADRARRHATEDEVRALGAELERVRAEFERVRADATGAAADAAALRASTSWRITRPLRVISGLARR